MPLLNLDKISLSFGMHPLLDEASLTITSALAMNGSRLYSEVLATCTFGSFAQRARRARWAA